jgi:hypothetical protein
MEVVMVQPFAQRMQGEAVPSGSARLDNRIVGNFPIEHRFASGIVLTFRQ